MRLLIVLIFLCIVGFADEIDCENTCKSKPEAVGYFFSGSVGCVCTFEEDPESNEIYEDLKKDKLDWTNPVNLKNDEEK